MNANGRLTSFFFLFQHKRHELFDQGHLNISTIIPRNYHLGSKSTSSSSKLSQSYCKILRYIKSLRVRPTYLSFYIKNENRRRRHFDGILLTAETQKYSMASEDQPSSFVKQKFRKFSRVFCLKMAYIGESTASSSGTLRPIFS